jgi:hypothetical protein
MAEKPKKRKLTPEHKAKISAAATRRHAKNRSATLEKATKGVVKKRRKTMRNGRAPAGVHVLRRNSDGRDLVECNAGEVLEALRIVRKIKEMVGSS